MNAGFSTVIRTSKRLASVCFLTAMFFAVTALPAFGQTTFSHDTGRCSGVNPLTIVGNPGDLLTEGYSSAPVVTISNANLGLDPDDEIDALSFGDDMSMQQTKNRMAVESRLRRASSAGERT